jgi:hypothetical protein
MGVTAIKRIINESSSNSVVINLENGNRVAVGAGGSMACDIWIPWCASVGDFQHNHFIRVEGTSLPTHRIWQAHHSDGDFVRATTGPNYVIPGTHINGHSKVNGDRVLVIRSSAIELLCDS